MSRRHNSERSVRRAGSGTLVEAPAGTIQPVVSCDGSGLLAALGAGATWLDGHRAAVDALNVFPVPDGDTGTNMSLTLAAALQEAESETTLSGAAIAERAAYGALMGARGNSGVILSQLLRGFANAVAGHAAIGPAELAAALDGASLAAKQAVTRPVEGTILTVASAAAAAAMEAAACGSCLDDVLDAAVDQTRAAVAATPDQLPVLREAGVVDAGAQGYLLILEGALRYLRGLPTHVEHPIGEADSSVIARVTRTEDCGYCTEFVVVGTDLDLARMRDDLAVLGDSTLVVGGKDIVHIHVHTDDPGRVLSYAAPLGRLHRVKIESMQDQHDSLVARVETFARSPSVAHHDGAPRVAPYVPLPDTAAQGLVGIVAVAPGAGVAAVFRSLGADAVVAGGQTMNPSTEEILGAIEALPQVAAIVLPNNRNVILAANQARDLSRKAVRIVPANSVPQGVTALVAYSPEADLDSNAAAMKDALAQVRTGEITVAIRGARLNGLEIHAGDILGLIDGEPVLAGSDRPTVTLDLLNHMGAKRAEVLTVYYGAEVDEQEAQVLGRLVRQRHDELRVEVVDGGQANYPYILSIE